jgi:ABC-2 type transport system ATP-binding protein
MQELCARGSSVFFSTHVLEVAEKLCNKIAIIRGGTLVVSGLTQDVRGNSSLEEVFLELIDHD